MSLRFNKPLEEEKSESEKTVNMFDGDNCTILIKIQTAFMKHGICDP